MTEKFKYTESLRLYLRERVGQVAPPDITGWISTLSDTELTEFGDMIRMASRGKPIEDVAGFMVAAMPVKEALETGTGRKKAQGSPTKKDLERFLGDTYTNIVSERKGRLKMKGRHISEPNDKSSHSGCSCCGGGH